MSNLEKYKVKLLKLHKSMVMNTSEKARKSDKFIQLYAQFHIVVGALWFNENIPEMKTDVNSATYMEIISEDELAKMECKIKEFIANNEVEA